MVQWLKLHAPKAGSPGSIPREGTGSTGSKQEFTCHSWKIPHPHACVGISPFWRLSVALLGFPGGTSGKEHACQCRRPKRYGFNPWVEKIPWSGYSNPLQYSCLEKCMNAGAWQATIHESQSQTRLKQLGSSHSSATIELVDSRKNWCFWPVVLEKTLESLLDWKEIQPVSPKGNQS